MATLLQAQVTDFQSRFGELLKALASEYESFLQATSSLGIVRDGSRKDVHVPIAVPEELGLNITPRQRATASAWKASANMGPSPPLPIDPLGETAIASDALHGAICKLDCFDCPPAPASIAAQNLSTNNVNFEEREFPVANVSSYVSSASVSFRLQARLGMADWNGMVSGQDLHIAVVSLGLMRYPEDDLNRLIKRMVKICGPEENEEEDEPKPQQSLLKRASSVLSTVSMITGSTPGDHDQKLISVHSLAEFLVSSSARKQLGAEYENMAAVIKEVLLSGDANRLVAELTSVRVDDLAAPPPKMDWDMVFEPLIAFVILLNGVAIGLQTEEELEKWHGWSFIESAFTLFYTAELLIRLRIYGCRKFYGGHDWFWGFFDTMIVIFALADTVMDLFFNDYALNITTFTIIRTIRLTRLTRLFRIFRFGILSDLTIMIKGLVAGCRTLLWANLLLFFTIYIIAVFATFTIGRGHTDLGRATEDELFASVPRAMLTSFRCFVGDCTTSAGEPIVKILFDKLGWHFVLGYLASFTIVTLGLFNLITALYVEVAIAAAKKSEEFDKRRAHRESLRIAHIAKALLKKFCIAQRHFNVSADTTAEEMSRTLELSDQTDLGEDQVISKDLFLLIVQDQEVQRLMNELDIPPDRANLFDVLDADGTGDLHVTEIVHGLLQIRGEARKSDVIASLLGVRAVQEMIRLMETRIHEDHEKIMECLGIERQNSALRKSIWDSKLSLNAASPSMQLGTMRPMKTNDSAKDLGKDAIGLILKECSRVQLAEDNFRADLRTRSGARQ